MSKHGNHHRGGGDWWLWIIIVIGIYAWSKGHSGTTAPNGPKPTPTPKTVCTEKCANAGRVLPVDYNGSYRMGRFA
jgi:hypothetical protein